MRICKRWIVQNNTAANLVEWGNPPISLAYQSPTSVAVPVTLTVHTYNADTEIGSRSIIVNYFIPSTVTPTISSVELSDADNHLTKYGKFIEGESHITARVVFGLAYNSPIRRLSISCGSYNNTYTLSGNNSFFNVIFVPMQSGTNVGINITITDARGRNYSTSSGAYKIAAVAPYMPPTVNVNDIGTCRCSKDGDPQPDGKYVRLMFSGAITSFGGTKDNTPKFTAVIRERGMSDWTVYYPITLESNKFSPQNAVAIIPNADLSKTYEVSVIAEDDFHTSVTGFKTIPVAFALMDFDRENHAIAFGQRANLSNTFIVGLTMNLAEHKITNMANPENDQDAATKAYVDAKIAELLSQLSK